MVVDTADKVAKLLSNKSCPSLKHIIVVEHCNLDELRALDSDVQVCVREVHEAFQIAAGVTSMGCLLEIWYLRTTA